MKLLLDTHLLLWSVGQSVKLPQGARALLADSRNELIFSVVSIWEVAIKRGRRRADFQLDPRLLRRGLLENGYRELAIGGDHVVAVEGLPPLHKDPFDRLLVAQSIVEAITLLTTDAVVAEYPAPVRKV